MNLKERLKLEELESTELSQAYWRFHRPKKKKEDESVDATKESGDTQGK